MTTRLLPPEEWSRLEGTDTASMFPHVAPGQMDVIVLEDDGIIVGACVRIRATHIEGAWILPAYRRVGAMKRLLGTAFEGVGAWVMTSAVERKTAARLRNLGGVSLGELFVLPIGEPVCRFLRPSV